jgi:hypothetical protein
VSLRIINWFTLSRWISNIIDITLIISFGT